ncbi:hypothetical protein NMY22_g11019 [Coprinellus aureogranulatus]|nr:hypothetical protein NMY22_g11019 [Coprinellus aureogranulatus]
MRAPPRSRALSQPRAPRPSALKNLKVRSREAATTRRAREDRRSASSAQQGARLHSGEADSNHRTHEPRDRDWRLSALKTSFRRWRDGQEGSVWERGDVGRANVHRARRPVHVSSLQEPCIGANPIGVRSPSRSRFIATGGSEWRTQATGERSALESQRICLGASTARSGGAVQRFGEGGGAGKRVQRAHGVGAILYFPQTGLSTFAIDQRKLRSKEETTASERRCLPASRHANRDPTARAAPTSRRDETGGRQVQGASLRVEPRGKHDLRLRTRGNKLTTSTASRHRSSLKARYGRLLERIPLSPSRVARPSLHEGGNKCRSQKSSASALRYADGPIVRSIRAVWTQLHHWTRDETVEVPAVKATTDNANATGPRKMQAEAGMDVGGWEVYRSTKESLAASKFEVGLGCVPAVRKLLLDYFKCTDISVTDRRNMYITLTFIQ